MSFVVDPFDKVTISFGGVCTLRCSHCYTVAKDFKYTRIRETKDIINDLKRINEKFQTICISGDTDPFLYPEETVDLITALEKEFNWTDIMFTSRLIPNDNIIEALIEIGISMSKSKRLLIPGISVITYDYPNNFENSYLVPSTLERLELLKKLSLGGLPCFLAMRPTFPFDVVPKSQVEQIITAAIRFAAVFLGEAFIMDCNNELTRNNGLKGVDEIEIAQSSVMTFLSQPSKWAKRIYVEEIMFLSEFCISQNRPFFLRSMSGVRFLKSYWNFKKLELEYYPDNLIDMSIENILP